MTDLTSTGAAAREGPALVSLGLPLEPPSQRRWTIVLRVVLAIPVYVVFVWYGVVSLVLVIGAWFSALFTKRVPDSIQRRLTGIQRWEARAYAYLYLLTDQWPGAHLEYRDGDVADLAIDHVELRRSAVLFRIVLAIPVFIVQSVVSGGLWPFSIWMWLVGLVRGRCPATLHQASALVVRFTTRANAYILLLTPTMPFRGLFGDGVEAPLAPSAPPDEPAPAPTDVAPPRGAPVTLPATWVVRPRVKAVMVWVLVIGSITSASSSAWRTTWGRVANHNLVVSTNNEAAVAVDSFAVTAQACTTVTCVRRAAATARASVLDAIDRLDGGWAGTRTAELRRFEGAMILESGTLDQMLAPGQTPASEQALYAQLGRQSRQQFAEAEALLKTV